MDLDLEYIRDMKFKYSMIYLLQKKDEKNKYILIFGGIPEHAINFLYDELKIETKFIKSIEKTGVYGYGENEVSNKIAKFNVWFNKKTGRIIEKYPVKYYTKYMYFIEMTESEVENIETLYAEYNAELEQNENKKNEIKKEKVQGSLF